MKNDLQMEDIAESLLSKFTEQIAKDLPTQSTEIHAAIACWLVGNPQRFADMNPTDITLAKKEMDYRYRIFVARYWGLSPERAYKSLLQKLCGLFIVRSKIRTWIALSRDRKRAVKDVLQEVIQEMLQSDRYMKEQTQWIKQCTDRASLRNLLTLATIEEYCLRPVRNQPLLVYRFVNYLRRSQRGGMTQVPSAEIIQLISEEIGTDATEGTLSLLDFEAIDLYEARQDKAQQQISRQQVKQQFTDYLQAKLGDTAVQWLELHLQGHTQESISHQLGLNIRQAYRLREKVSYHAIRIFSLKEQPDLVFSWLKTSLKQQNLGLTPAEWKSYWESLTPEQQTLLDDFKAGKTVEQIAQVTNLTQRQVASKWAELYLLAQDIQAQDGAKHHALATENQNLSQTVSQQLSVDVKTKRGTRTLSLDKAEALVREDESSRIERISALGREGDEDAVPDLCYILANDESPKVRSTAAKALGMIGRKG